MYTAQLVAESGRWKSLNKSKLELNLYVDVRSSFLKFYFDFSNYFQARRPSFFSQQIVFLKFAYQKWNYHGVAPPPPMEHVKFEVKIRKLIVELEL